GDSLPPAAEVRPAAAVRPGHPPAAGGRLPAVHGPDLAGGHPGGRLLPPPRPARPQPRHRAAHADPREPDADAAGEGLPDGTLQPVARGAAARPARPRPVAALPRRGDLPAAARLPPPPRRRCAPPRPPPRRAG